MSKATAKAKITSVFKTNGSAGITGANSQSALTGMLDDVYADLAEKVATPTNGDLIKTDASGNPVDSGISSSSVSSHLASTSNPHSVTKAQVGLGNCDNTSDANKPISTATQSALDLKANSADVTSALADKADIDGNYPLLQAGLATNIAGSDKVDAEIVFRTAGGSADIGSGTTKIDKILGNSYAWNQLVQNGDAQTNQYWYVDANGTMQIANGIVKVTKSGNCTFHNNGIEPLPIAGHKYMVVVDLRADTSVTATVQVAGNNNHFSVTSTFTTFAAIRDAGNIIPYNQVIYFMFNGDASYLEVRNVQLFDLTLIFGSGNEPATVEALKATEIGKFICSGYHAFDASSLLSSKETGIKTVGFNQWDEQWELGNYNISTGVKVPSSLQIRSKNPFNILPNTNYYCKVPTANGVAFFILWYDANNNYLSYNYVVNNVVTSPFNAHHANFYLSQAYGTTYNHDICINISHSGIRNGEYEPYWASTTNLPVTTATGKLNGAGSSVVVFADGMKSVGSVRDEAWNEVVNGVLTGKARVKIGSRAYQAGDENDATLLTDKTNTFYPLATPQEYTMDTPWAQGYRVDDFGTEEIVPSQGSTPTSAPLYLEVEYAMNVKDAVRNLPKNYVSAQGTDNTLARIESALASVYGITMTHVWDNTNNRYNIALSGGWQPVASAPASASATGSKGQYFIDSTYLYICVGSNSWTRVAIATW